MVQGRIIGMRCSCKSSHRNSRRAPLHSNPDVTTTSTRGLTHHVRNPEAIKDPRESITIVNSALHQIRRDHAGFLTVEVKTQQTKNARLIGQTHQPRRRRFRRANTEDQGVAILVQTPINITLHHPHLTARTQPTRHIPRRQPLGRHAQRSSIVRNYVKTVYIGYYGVISFDSTLGGIKEPPVRAGDFD